MVDFTAVTDEVLERARFDPAYRRKLMSDNLEVLLAKLNRMRSSGTGKGLDKTAARQIREGVDMAVKLAELLQVAKRDNDTSRAA